MGVGVVSQSGLRPLPGDGACALRDTLGLARIERHDPGILALRRVRLKGRFDLDVE